LKISSRQRRDFRYKLQSFDAQGHSWYIKRYLLPCTT